MRNNTRAYYPRLDRYKTLLAVVAVFFMLALSSTLVSLPFSTKQNRSVILNTVEEEAGNNSANTINEEHKHGKTPINHVLDIEEILKLQWVSAVEYNVPASVDILSSLFIKSLIQPPEC